jgi:hypothetical protein
METLMSSKPHDEQASDSLERILQEVTLLFAQHSYHRVSARVIVSVQTDRRQQGTGSVGLPLRTA